MRRRGATHPQFEDLLGSPDPENPMRNQDARADNSSPTIQPDDQQRFPHSDPVNRSTPNEHAVVVVAVSESIQSFEKCAGEPNRR